MCWVGCVPSCPHIPASAPLQVFLTSPTEVAKVRLQTQTQTQTTQQRRPSASGPSTVPPPCPAPPARSAPGPKYRGPLHCLATVAREEGLRGLYKGSSALLLRDGHSFATYFLSYAILCEWLTPAGCSQPGDWALGPGKVAGDGDEATPPPSASQVGAWVSPAGGPGQTCSGQVMKVDLGPGWLGLPWVPPALLGHPFQP